MEDKTIPRSFPTGEEELKIGRLFSPQTAASAAHPPRNSRRQHYQLSGRKLVTAELHVAFRLLGRTRRPLKGAGSWGTWSPWTRSSRRDDKSEGVTQTMA